MWNQTCLAMGALLLLDHLQGEKGSLAEAGTYMDPPLQSQLRDAQSLHWILIIYILGVVISALPAILSSESGVQRRRDSSSDTDTWHEVHEGWAEWFPKLSISTALIAPSQETTRRCFLARRRWHRCPLQGPVKHGNPFPKAAAFPRKQPVIAGGQRVKVPEDFHRWHALLARHLQVNTSFENMTTKGGALQPPIGKVLADGNCAWRVVAAVAKRKWRELKKLHEKQMAG